VNVGDFGGTDVGSYAISVQRLNRPIGCRALSSGAVIVGSIAAPGEMDCYMVAAVAGDRVRIRLVDVSGSSVTREETLRPSETALCGPTTTDDVTCVNDATGHLTIIVEDAHQNGPEATRSRHGGWISQATVR